MKKFFLSAVVILLLVLFSPFWLGFVFRDIALVDTSDLEIIIELPEVNAYDKLIEFKEGDDVSKLLKNAAKADGYLEPGLSEKLTYESAIPTLVGFMDIIRASITDAEFLLESDDEEGAIEELERSLKVTQMIQDAPGALMQQLIGITAKEELINAILDMNLDVDLSDFSDNETGYLNALKVEFMLAKNVVLLDETDIDKGLLFDAPYYFHPNETIEIFAERARYAIQSFQADCDESLDPLSDPTTPDFLFFTENAVGKLLVEALSPRIIGNTKKCALEELMMLSN